MLVGSISKNSPLQGQENPCEERFVIGLDSDAEILRRIAAGDDDALRQLYAEHGQHMAAYALRLTNDPALAEDVLQEALLVVWKTAAKYRGEGRVISWLLGIVHHTALKALRHPSQPISEAIENSLASPAPSPEEQTQSAELAGQVRRGLESLSPEHRAVLELVFYQKMSLEEAALICDCPVGTIKSRLSYARQHLRRVLTRMEEA